MNKIELIHNKEVLRVLKSLMTKDRAFGFTTLNVHQGYGPLKGEYKEDHIGDEQFFSIILIEDDKKADELIKNLKKFTKGNKFICLTSKVNFTKGDE